MSDLNDIDAALIKWGDRLFYPGNRMVRASPEPRLKSSARNRAAFIRERVEAIVVRRAPQVMVKVTGGGRGMKAIAAHFRYISKKGRLEIEDEKGQRSEGREAVGELVEEWRFGGSAIDDVSDRREAFNIMLSMPRGVDALTVQRAAREFAQTELGDHKYVMVLHDHQANPHVHISVRAESKYGRRLNPRKADLQRWRETFAEKLRGWGVDAEATRQASRGVHRNYPALWQVKAAASKRLRIARAPAKGSAQAIRTRIDSVEAWERIAAALADSAHSGDRKLGINVRQFLRVMSLPRDPLPSGDTRETAVARAPHGRQGVAPPGRETAAEAISGLMSDRARGADR